MITAIGCKSSANQIQKEGEEKNTLKRKEEKAKKKKRKKKVISYTCLFTPHQS